VNCWKLTDIVLEGSLGVVIMKLIVVINVSLR